MAKGKRSKRVLVNNAARREKFGVPLQKTLQAESLARLHAEMAQQASAKMEDIGNEQPADAAVSDSEKMDTERSVLSVRKRIEKQKAFKKRKILTQKDKKKRYAARF